MRLPVTTGIGFGKGKDWGARRKRPQPPAAAFVAGSAVVGVLLLSAVLLVIRRTEASAEKVDSGAGGADDELLSQLGVRNIPEPLGGVAYVDDGPTADRMKQVEQMVVNIGAISPRTEGAQLEILCYYVNNPNDSLVRGDTWTSGMAPLFSFYHSANGSSPRRSTKASRGRRGEEKQTRYHQMKLALRRRHCCCSSIFPVLFSSASSVASTVGAEIRVLAGRSHHVSDPLWRGGDYSEDDSESEEFTPAVSSSHEKGTGNGDGEMRNMQGDDAVRTLSHKAATTERNNMAEMGSSDETGVKLVRRVRSVQRTLASFVRTMLRNVHKREKTALLLTLVGIYAILLVRSANRKSGEGMKLRGKELLDRTSPSSPASSERGGWRPGSEPELAPDSCTCSFTHYYSSHFRREVAGHARCRLCRITAPWGVPVETVVHSVVLAAIVMALVSWFRGPARDAAAAKPRWGRRSDTETARAPVPAIASQRDQTVEGRLEDLRIENTDGPPGGVVFQENVPTVNTIWQVTELMASVELVSHRLRDSLQVLLSEVRAVAGETDYRAKMSRLVALSQTAQLELIHSNLREQKQLLLQRSLWIPSLREWLLGYHRRIAKEILKGVPANRKRMVATLESGSPAQAAQLVSFINAESNTIVEMAHNAIGKVRALKEGSSSQFDRLDERYKVLEQMMADRIRPSP
ncbi:hypothetical protein CSUI_003747 [Cystoisospora suis]|uniref:Transmembrane protein n=1 Tax=Cystoisospora suis TaxID=483139 RepID=A0A2C6L3X2_9APIC|nr:hypothetical protein CSUI_003747 [Cystoisospora suis]